MRSLRNCLRLLQGAWLVVVEAMSRKFAQPLPREQIGRRNGPAVQSCTRLQLAVIIHAVTNEDMDFISNLFRSLETGLKKDIAEGRDEVRAVAARLDQTNVRLDRIGGMLNGGARAVAK